MLFKRKNIFVIFLSSLIISTIIVSTIAVYTGYIMWKEDLSKTTYNNSIYGITADIFRSKLELYGIKTSSVHEKGVNSVLRLEGRIKNTSAKTITSVSLELSFSSHDGTVLYRDWFYPLGEEALSKSPFFSSIKRNKISIYPGEDIQFEYLIRNCPEEVRTFIMANETFAKNENDRNIALKIKIAGLTVI